MDLMKEKKFGFGCMRLPVLDAKDPASFDYEKIINLFDAYLEMGFTYGVYVSWLSCRRSRTKSFGRAI